MENISFKIFILNLPALSGKTVERGKDKTNI